MGALYGLAKEHGPSKTFTVDLILQRGNVHAIFTRMKSHRRPASSSLIA